MDYESGRSHFETVVYYGTEHLAWQSRLKAGHIWYRSAASDCRLLLERLALKNTSNGLEEICRAIINHANTNKENKGRGGGKRKGKDSRYERRKIRQPSRRCPIGVVQLQGISQPPRTSCAANTSLIWQSPKAHTYTTDTRKKKSSWNCLCRLDPTWCWKLIAVA